MAFKYKNTPTAVDGIIFQSKKESLRYTELKMLERSGVISNLRWQVPFELRVNGVLVCKYIADFVYLDQQGREVVEDVKSEATKTAVYRIKAKLLIACHGLRIVEV